ncbi:hypothetical protein [Verrucosispora sp. WMMD573]|uniref:aromatic-ring hydroxylase C-terminal domain-containing protein n=1 Tax=Verrucosispora sp. WMMD573 TaxID=3015149 RepID=UPI0032B1D782
MAATAERAGGAGRGAYVTLRFVVTWTSRSAGPAAWIARVDTVTAREDRMGGDALLIRPDGCVAWASSAG